MANKFRAVPWKRNLQKIPDPIRAQVEAFESDILFVGITKTLALDEISSAPLRQLRIPDTEGKATEIIPSEDMGKYSHRNKNGWEVVREDLPKITKTFYWETPNFGDASRYGTHTHYWTREVYQREIHEPRFYSVIARTLKLNPAGGRVVHIRIKEELNRASSTFEDDLLFMLNLLQENCGAAGVVSSDTAEAEYIKTLNLDWEVFPPGSAQEVADRLTAKAGADPNIRDKIEERVRLFSRLTPVAYLKGSGGFGSYIGAKYADDLVVFENVEYGNALYVLYDNWEEISKRPRIDLLKGTDARFDRLPHRVGWDEAFGKILRREKRKRGI
jgi:hypothetical protein